MRMIGRYFWKLMFLIDDVICCLYTLVPTQCEKLWDWRIRFCLWAVNGYCDTWEVWKKGVRET